jgi:DNA-directed RNA polymerase specialized sigma24 family protein
MEPRAEDYIGMMKRLAYSFHSTTGLPFDELLSSAFLAFAHCRQTYDPNKAAFSTYLYHAAKTRMIDFCHSAYHINLEDPNMKRQPSSPYLYEAAMALSHQTNHQDPEYLCMFKDSLKNMSEEAQQVCEMIFESPAEFLAQSKPKLSRGVVYRKLREKGWSWSKIWNSFREIKSTLNEMC